MNTTVNESRIPSGIGLLPGKIALVIGASRGIGAAAARLFAAEGASVVLAGRTTSQLKEVTEQIRDAGGTADLVTCDLAAVDSVRNAVSYAVDLHGRLDVAFNNGAIPQQPGPMDQADHDDVERVIAVNLTGIWAAISAEARAIRDTAGRGAILNTSTVGSFRSNPELPIYGAAKRGVNSLTESAAVSYGPDGIRVNAIAPGTTLTSMVRAWNEHTPGIIDRLNAMTPLGRAADPDEMAEAAAWLLSDRASYVSGVVLRVDGGMGA